MLILKNLGYTHPNKNILFDNINLVVNKNEKLALVGNNGAGKSTLLKIIAGFLPVASGELQTDAKPYYVPQHFGQYNQLTIAQALRIDDKLNALKEILAGHVTDTNMNVLDDDWTIDERCREALQYWGLEDLDLTRKMDSVSGGQKTKIFLAGITIHQPELILMDEPTNHLDIQGRHLLYHLIRSSTVTLVVVSHDRALLNLLHTVCELSKSGIHQYGGNYDFYKEQKQIERNALDHDVKSKEKELRKAREVERETAERQQKLNARGKKKQEKAGMPTIMMNTLRNNAEQSTARLKSVHEEKREAISQELNELRSAFPDMDKMKFGFDDSALHKGKILITANDMNFRYKDQYIWPSDLSFQINSGERIAISGANGSGKTTLIKLILGELQPGRGTLAQAEMKTVYIDQEYSLISNHLSVYEQARQFNTTALQEHEIKIRLTWFLFTKEDWDKPCSTLSGGEKMRLVLCCLTISHLAPDMIVLDEPTNNLDIQNIEILTHAINGYRGTVIAISHDVVFLQDIGIQRVIELES